MSAHVNKNVVICILMAVCCTCTIWAEEKTPPPPDPYANAQILVEAFVMEVSTASLKEVGVDPVGQSPNGATVTKLAACLANESAKVISGAKVSVKQGREGKSREERRYFLKEVTKSFVPQQGGKAIESVNTSYKNYNLEKSLGVFAKLVSDTAISTEYKYLEGGILTDPKHYDPNNLPPPDTYNYSWEGVLSLCPGKPVIAGAMQNKNSVILLILTATVQYMPEAKP